MAQRFAADRPLRLARSALAIGAAAGGVWTLWCAVRTPGVPMSPAFMQLEVTWLALFAVCALFTTPYRVTVLWSALSVVGYALGLQLVDAGTAVLYQHLRPAVASMATLDWWMLGGLAAYVALVCAGLAAHRRRLLAWVDSEIGRTRALVVLGAWAVISASPLKNLGGFALEIVLATTLAVAATGAVVLAAAALPTGSTPRLTEWIERVLGRGEAGSGRVVDPVAATAAAFVTVACGVLAFVVWERHPHISDEISFLFQAKYFATGSLAAPGVPVPELFAAYQIDCSVERCLSVLQPGWPALLSVGVRAGAPWLVNPVLAGLNAMLFFWFVRELYGTRLARGATLLLASSPWYLFLGMSFMNHQSTLTGGLLGVLGTALAVRTRRPIWAAVAGAGVGLTSLMRPMDGLIVAVVAGLPLLFAGSLRFRIAAPVIYVGGITALASLNLAYNHALTGDPLDFPVTSYVNELWGEGTNNLGFGPDRGVYPLWSHMDGFPGHSPAQAVVNAALNVTALEVDLFGWATGSLLPLLLLLAWGRLRRPDFLLIGWVLVINALYSLYWFASGPDFAARYWFLAVVPLVVLTARGVEVLAARIGSAERGRAAVAFAIALLVAQALLVFVPWRSTDKYHGYFTNRPLIREALRAGSLPEGVFLIRGANQPDYAAAMVYTAPDLATGTRVFAYDSLDDSLSRLREAYPERALFWLEGPSVTGDVYRVHATNHDDRTGATTH